MIEQVSETATIDRSDDKLGAMLDDEIVVVSVDTLHIGGDTPRDVTASINVVGEIDARPRVSQNVVSDAVLRAKKNIVEATAYLELARIFNSMGLADGATEKAAQGLDRVDEIIRMQQALPTGLKEEAFKLRWELYIAQEDYANAIATCKLFNSLYPTSPFVDQALIGIGQIKFEEGAYDEAIRVYQQVLELETSQAKDQAQFMIAEALQAKADADAEEPVISEQAIQAYRQCAQKYPDSEYAGQALTEIVDYYVMTKDYQQADDMLDQIFQDYPDGKFLDSMLLKWVLVAYRMGNVQKAYDKCSLLLFEYPSSPHAETAQSLLPKIEARLPQAGASAATE
jgi:TolA-binding protein